MDNEVKVNFLAEARFKANKAVAKEKHNMSFPTRYRTRLQQVVQDHINDELPRDRFPYDAFPPVPASEDELNLYRRRVIVFVIGGLSYSEIRGMNEIMEAVECSARSHCARKAP